MTHSLTRSHSLTRTSSLTRTHSLTPSLAPALAHSFYHSRDDWCQAFILLESHNLSVVVVVDDKDLKQYTAMVTSLNFGICVLV